MYLKKGNIDNKKFGKKTLKLKGQEPKDFKEMRLIDEIKSDDDYDMGKKS